MPRLFVAIDLPDEVAAQVERLCIGLPAIRWVEPEQLHLTLRFIGEVEAPTFYDLGEALGAVYLTDLTAALFGGLPTALNVFVLDAPGYTPATAVSLIQGAIEANASMLGDANIENLAECTVNNMPAVCATATANLANFGIANELFAKVTGIVANDKVYILTLATTTDKRGEKEPVFDQIIGTFRPE